MLIFNTEDPFEKLPFTQKEVKVTSEELMEMGFNGPELGRILRDIFTNIHFKNIVNNKGEILEFAKSKI